MEASERRAEECLVNVVVRGRNVEVPEHFQQRVTEKLAPCERLDPKIMDCDVELHHERNPRQQSVAQRVEITLRTRGPVVRAEATAGDFYSALDLAAGRLETRLRRAHERRTDRAARVNGKAKVSSTAVAPPAGEPPLAQQEQPAGEGPSGSAAPAPDFEEREDLVPGLVVRVKQHEAEPMSAEDALFRMEMVGHDFYLFSDTETGRPSVVYRRKGYDFGLIQLVP